jgi:ABC-2 type transport system permease protein
MSSNKSSVANAVSQVAAPMGAHAAPAERTIGSVNWVGLKTLYVKEVRRFMKVQLQTIWAPSVTTLLFLVIFTVAFGREGAVVMGKPFADFIAPGLIVMGMIQNAFANSSFSLLVGKIQGTIVDYLMPPLSNAELLVAMVGAAVTRAFAVGGAVWLAMMFWPGVHVSMLHPFVALWFGLMGSILVALLGVLTSIWAEKFDHAAVVSHANPFFYIISGFRYGFLGTTDSNIMLGGTVLLVVNVALAIFTYLLLRSGWKIKA